MERSSQTNDMRRNDIWIFISLCTHNDMTTPCPDVQCWCVCAAGGFAEFTLFAYPRVLCRRSMPTLNARGRGGSSPEGCTLDCVNAFCELFSINSPLEHGHALHCNVNARQICVPIQHKTKGKWMRSFFVFYVLMFEHTLFSCRGCTTQRKAHHRETIPAQKTD